MAKYYGKILYNIMVKYYGKYGKILFIILW